MVSIVLLRFFIFKTVVYLRSFIPGVTSAPWFCFEDYCRAERSARRYITVEALLLCGRRPRLIHYLLFLHNRWSRGRMLQPSQRQNKYVSVIRKFNPMWMWGACFDFSRGGTLWLRTVSEWREVLLTQNRRKNDFFLILHDFRSCILIDRPHGRRR